MKEKDFDSENIIKFKALADKIKSISENESDDEDDFDLDEFKESGFADLFAQLLSESLSEPYEPASDEEIYDEIVDNYFVLIDELGIDEFNFFRFASYDYCREVIIDGKVYDLDGEFCHDDLDATGALCAIDCLIGDLDDEEAILKNIERMINIQNRE